MSNFTRIFLTILFFGISVSLISLVILFVLKGDFHPYHFVGPIFFGLLGGSMLKQDKKEN